MFLVSVCSVFLTDLCVEGASKLQGPTVPAQGPLTWCRWLLVKVRSSCGSPLGVSQPGLFAQVLARPFVVDPFIYFYFVSETVSHCSQAGLRPVAILPQPSECVSPTIPSFPLAITKVCSDPWLSTKTVLEAKTRVGC